jgi:hypothetical protein
MLPQTSPGETVSVRVTGPEKWFTADTVIVKPAELPALTGEIGVMDIVKSRNWKMAVVL